MDELLLRSLMGGLALAIALGPLGCFVVWRHMAYFGDTIAHAALLGVALALISEVVPVTAALVIVAVAVALLVGRFSSDRRFSTDTMLGILSHGTLALGIVLMSLSRQQADMNAYLFGDILAMSWGDVWFLLGLAVVVVLRLRVSWRPLLMIPVSPAIAHVEGVHVKRTQQLLTVLLAVVIAVSIKLVGVLLITALLIMPAAAARYLARSPTMMAWLAALLAVLSVTGGVFGSFAIDTPTGPTIVVVASFVFVVLGAVTRLRKGERKKAGELTN